MAHSEHSLATYVSDMLALERHVTRPFDAQMKSDEFARSSDGLQIATRLSGLGHKHADALKDCLDFLGGHEAAGIKDTVGDVTGAVAGAIDQMRKTKVSKALRDDYTALALCTAGYTMLQTTALAMRDAKVAGLAERHLQDYAQAVMDIGEMLPIVVVAELSDLGLDVDRNAIEPSRQAAKRAWSGGAIAHESEEGRGIGVAAGNASSVN